MILHTDSYNIAYQPYQAYHTLNHMTYIQKIELDIVVMTTGTVIGRLIGRLESSISLQPKNSFIQYHNQIHQYINQNLDSWLRDGHRM